MPAIELDQDAERADDDNYVADKYREVEDSNQRRYRAIESDVAVVVQTGFSIGSLTIHRGCGGDTAM